MIFEFFISLKNGSRPRCICIAQTFLAEPEAQSKYSSHLSSRGNGSGSGASEIGGGKGKSRKKQKGFGLFCLRMRQVAWVGVKLFSHSRTPLVWQNTNQKEMNKNKTKQRGSKNRFCRGLRFIYLFFHANSSTQINLWWGDLQTIKEKTNKQNKKEIYRTIGSNIGVNL